MNLAMRQCSTCREEHYFERPPCADGHGDECPERVCVVCGFAIVAGFDVGTDAEVVAPLPAPRAA